MRAVSVGVGSFGEWTKYDPVIPQCNGIDLLARNGLEMFRSYVHREAHVMMQLYSVFSVAAPLLVVRLATSSTLTSSQQLRPSISQPAPKQHTLASSYLIVSKSFLLFRSLYVHTRQGVGYVRRIRPISRPAQGIVHSRSLVIPRPPSNLQQFIFRRWCIDHVADPRVPARVDL